MKPFSLLATLMLAGCASLPPSDIAESHPANPDAAQATYPALKLSLMTQTNFVLDSSSEASQQTTPETKHKHDHD